MKIENKPDLINDSNSNCVWIVKTTILTNHKDNNIKIVQSKPFFNFILNTTKRGFYN